MLTVLIATYNGARTLPYVLNIYCQLEPPDGGWQLVIVDNRSTDQTKEVIASFTQRLPLTYLFEPRQGKNVALNTGLSRVAGDLIVFTDDDTLPQPNWLRQIRLAADSQSEFVIFGGPILPKWEVLPEDWVSSWIPLGPVFGILPPLEEGPINPRSVFGANMAIRAAIFHSGYRFDETVGPQGGSYAMGSEADLTRRLAKAGFKAWHCRDAVIHHMIRSYQMNKDWVLARAVRYGRGQYRQAAKEPLNTPLSLFSIPLSLVTQILVQGLRVCYAQVGGNVEKAFKARWQLNYLVGRAIEARLL